MPIELAGSASAQQTMTTAGRISALQANRKQFPEIACKVIYVTDGGPRCILGLNPRSPTLNRTYAVINVDEGADLNKVIEETDASLDQLAASRRAWSAALLAWVNVQIAFGAWWRVAG